VEPHRGHEVTYNRWYERDHFYAGCMVGPWLFAGRRFVAPRSLKDLRFPTDPPMFGDSRLGSYLAIYWILDGKHDEHVRWALDQVNWLHANGRMFAERDHIHTLLYRFAWTAARDADGVPKELALDHPYSALVATFVDRADGVDGSDLSSWFSEHAGESPGIGHTMLFEPIPLAEDAPVTQKGIGDLSRRSLLMRFADVAPAEAAAQATAVDQAFATDGLGTVLWSSPFRPTIPGTDTYTDELW
jgi:hypothetical protein